jgi:murein DD-endopeptidase MepM/ murein hydrolase activator NlpD
MPWALVATVAVSVVAVSSLATAPALGAFGDRTLRRGASGSDVRTMQVVLTRMKIRTAADGEFGAGTERSVKRFEDRVNGRIDGIVPPGQAYSMRVWQARVKASGVPPGGWRFGDRTLALGVKGPDVRTLQRILTKLKVATAVDGDFGPATASRVRAYERRVRGLVDGRVSRGQALAMAGHAANGRSGIPATSTRAYIFPIRGSHTYGTGINRFGADRGDHAHGGQDVFAAAGTRLVAVRHGRVVSRGSGGGAGNHVVIRGDDGRDYVYMHLLRAAVVATGQSVATGQTVGQVGCTGSCSGDHLHFEIWVGHWYDGGHAIDPLATLRAWDRVS